MPSTLFTRMNLFKSSAESHSDYTDIWIKYFSMPTLKSIKKFHNKSSIDDYFDFLQYKPFDPIQFKKISADIQDKERLAEFLIEFLKLEDIPVLPIFALGQTAYSQKNVLEKENRIGIVTQYLIRGFIIFSVQLPKIIKRLDSQPDNEDFPISYWKIIHYPLNFLLSSQKDVLIDFVPLLDLFLKNFSLIEPYSNMQPIHIARLNVLKTIYPFVSQEQDFGSHSCLIFIAHIYEQIYYELIVENHQTEFPNFAEKIIQVLIPLSDNLSTKYLHHFSHLASSYLSHIPNIIPFFGNDLFLFLLENVFFITKNYRYLTQPNIASLSYGFTLFIQWILETDRKPYTSENSFCSPNFLDEKVLNFIKTQKLKIFQHALILNSPQLLSIINAYSIFFISSISLFESIFGALSQSFSSIDPNYRNEIIINLLASLSHINPTTFSDNLALFIQTIYLICIENYPLAKQAKNNITTIKAIDSDLAFTCDRLQCFFLIFLINLSCISPENIDYIITIIDAHILSENQYEFEFSMQVLMTFLNFDSVNHFLSHFVHSKLLFDMKTKFFEEQQHIDLIVSFYQNACLINPYIVFTTSEFMSTFSELVLISSKRYYLISSYKSALFGFNDEIKFAAIQNISDILFHDPLQPSFKKFACALISLFKDSVSCFPENTSSIIKSSRLFDSIVHVLISYPDSYVFQNGISTICKLCQRFPSLISLLSCIKKLNKVISNISVSPEIIEILHELLLCGSQSQIKAPHVLPLLVRLTKDTTFESSTFKFLNTLCNDNAANCYHCLTSGILDLLIVKLKNPHIAPSVVPLFISLSYLFFSKDHFLKLLKSLHPDASKAPNDSQFTILNSFINLAQIDRKSGIPESNDFTGFFQFDGSNFGITLSEVDPSFLNNTFSVFMYFKLKSTDGILFSNGHFNISISHNTLSVGDHLIFNVSDNHWHKFICSFYPQGLVTCSCDDVCQEGIPIPKLPLSEHLTLNFCNFVGYASSIYIYNGTKQLSFGKKKTVYTPNYIYPCFITNNEIIPSIYQYINDKTEYHSLSSFSNSLQRLETSNRPSELIFSFEPWYVYDSAIFNVDSNHKVASFNGYAIPYFSHFLSFIDESTFEQFIPEIYMVNQKIKGSKDTQDQSNLLQLFIQCISIILSKNNKSYQVLGGAYFLASIFNYISPSIFNPGVLLSLIDLTLSLENNLKNQMIKVIWCNLSFWRRCPMETQQILYVQYFNKFIFEMQFDISLMYDNVLFDLLSFFSSSFLNNNTLPNQNAKVSSKDSVNKIISFPDYSIKYEKKIEISKEDSDTLKNFQIRFLQNLILFSKSPKIFKQLIYILIFEEKEEVELMVIEILKEVLIKNISHSSYVFQKNGLYAPIVSTLIRFNLNTQILFSGFQSLFYLAHAFKENEIDKDLRIFSSSFDSIMTGITILSQEMINNIFHKAVDFLNENLDFILVITYLAKYVDSSFLLSHFKQIEERLKNASSLPTFFSYHNWAYLLFYFSKKARNFQIAFRLITNSYFSSNYPPYYSFVLILLKAEAILHYETSFLLYILHQSLLESCSSRSTTEIASLISNSVTILLYHLKKTSITSEDENEINEIEFQKYEMANNSELFEFQNDIDMNLAYIICYSIKMYLFQTNDQIPHFDVTAQELFAYLMKLQYSKFQNQTILDEFESFASKFQNKAWITIFSDEESYLQKFDLSTSDVCDINEKIYDRGKTILESFENVKYIIFPSSQNSENITSQISLAPDDRSFDEIRQSFQSMNLEHIRFLDAIQKCASVYFSSKKVAQKKAIIFSSNPNYIHSTRLNKYGIPCFFQSHPNFLSTLQNHFTGGSVFKDHKYIKIKTTPQSYSKFIRETFTEKLPVHKQFPAFYINLIGQYKGQFFVSFDKILFESSTVNYSFTNEFIKSKKHVMISISDIQFIYQKAICHENTGFEIILDTGETFLFQLMKESSRVELFEFLTTLENSEKFAYTSFSPTSKGDNTSINALKNACGSSIMTLSPQELLAKSKLTNLWQNRKISNFEYLLQLNFISGRSFNNISQYPIFPWVIADYTSSTLDLSKEETFRDLSKPIGALNEKRLSKLQGELNEMNDPFESCLYRSHFSNSGITVGLLIREEPFTLLSIRLQGNQFDSPDRIFNSIPRIWHSITSLSLDYRELIPQFYFDHDFLLNLHHFNFGEKASGEMVNDVILPPWASSAYEFIHKQREALESDHVSMHLNEWIDLMFGYLQRSKESFNLFHPLTYPFSFLDLPSNFNISEECIQRAQVHRSHFGVMPTRIFSVPSLKRGNAPEKVPIKEFTESRNPIIFIASGLAITSEGEILPMNLKLPEPPEKLSFMYNANDHILFTIHEDGIRVTSYEIKQTEIVHLGQEIVPPYFWSKKYFKNCPSKNYAEFSACIEGWSLSRTKLLILQSSQLIITCIPMNRNFIENKYNSLDIPQKRFQFRNRSNSLNSLQKNNKQTNSRANDHFYLRFCDFAGRSLGEIFFHRKVESVCVLKGETGKERLVVITCDHSISLIDLQRFSIIKTYQNVANGLQSKLLTVHDSNSVLVVKRKRLYVPEIFNF